MNQHTLSALFSISGGPVLTAIHEAFIEEKDIQVDLLRLDLLHPEVSGNKWYKLKYNLEAAMQSSAHGLLSFGGAYSNHLHALAFAGHLLGMPTIGIVRGEQVSNTTLDDCLKWGMQLHFISRQQYRLRHDAAYWEDLHEQFPGYAIIPEGGNNALGRKGCMDILQDIDLQQYSHLGTSVGSGATLAGIVEASLPVNHVLGFAALRHAKYLEAEIKLWTSKTNWTLLTDAHEGGFGKHTPELLHFIETFRNKQGIELDFVYNAKMMLCVYRMISAGDFPEESRILLLHTGGLQGNRSIR